jgi:hypothetical protein
MPATRPEKITFGEMRSTGVRGVLVYCADYKCSHSIAISADQWPQDKGQRAKPLLLLYRLDDRMIAERMPLRLNGACPLFRAATS